ncbi:unnamed protein product [Schistosoma turkestanicum]|nr:unnamed protein product [Schistosoma turkestanicum]
MLTSSGVGRGSRVNSKKNLASSTIPSVSSSEPFSPSQRPINQPSKKLQSWNTGSSANVNFNSTMILPTQSMGIPMANSGFIGSMDSRESPVAFATQLNNGSMRPNSGPPVNNNLSISTTGMAYNESSNSLDAQSNHNMRLPVSPRQSYCSSQTPMQQQQYSVPNTSSNCTSYPSGHGNNSFYNQTNQHVSNINMNTPQQTLTTNNSQMCYPNNSVSLNNSNNNAQHTPPNVHYQSHTMQPNSHIQTISSPMTSNCNRISAQSNSNSQNYLPPASLPPPPSSNSSIATTTTTTAVGSASYTYTDRLVCPITNGMVWGPTQIQLNDIMHQYLPEGIYIRRFEFDLTANHLSTIVGRSDLDIVVCSHLLSEPLQVCHWPPDAVQIRFNDYLLRLDRSSVNGGQPAHKVACVKQLCRPGRNQLEIAILGLGEDPNQPSTMAKRRATAQTLEAHRFAAFMAHMPALNVLLDGLQRRRPAGINTLCDIIEGRIGTRNLNEDGSITRNISGPPQTPVIAELNLICPVFRTRMRIPGRIAGCQHVEAFDMEAFLRREVLWPRLNCPICGHKSPAGLDGLCIDTTILYASQLVPQTAESILVRSDGYWRLVPPLCLDLPVDIDQWQPLIGPMTELVSQAFNQISSKGPLRGQTPGNAGVRQVATHCHTNTSQTAPDWIQPPLQRISPQQHQQHQSPKVTTTSRKPQPLQPSIQTTKVVTSQQDLTNSPQRISDCCSPSNQTNLENVCSSVSCGPSGELVDSAYSSAASRPSSQPVSWIGTQSSPDKMSTSTSLPSSPSVSTRSVSCFSMAAIPGVNMCVVDSMSSTSSSLSTTSTYPTMITKSFLSTSASSNMGKGVPFEQSIEVGSDDNSYQTPITTTISVPSKVFSTNEVSAKSGVVTSEYCSPSAVNLESSSSLASSTRRCPTSSLNMGLDFLLTEDQTVTSIAMCSGERSPQMSSAIVSAAVRSLLTSTCDTVGSSISPAVSASATNSDDFPVTKTVCSNSSCSEQSTSPKSENISFNREQPSDYGDRLIPNSFLSGEETCKLSSELSNCTPKVEGDVKMSLNELNNEDTSQVLSEVSMPTKRMKLESPQISPQIYLHACIAEDTANLPAKQDDDTVSNQQSTMNSVTTTTLNDGLYEVKKVISGHSNDIDDGNIPEYVGLVSNDFDEEKISIELIHSVSSKIDQLDLFLDESYIRFVEHFPCV